MKSVALAMAPRTARVGDVVETMLGSVGNDMCTWSIAGSGAMAVGVGSSERDAMSEGIVSLPGRVKVGIDVPGWMGNRVERRVAELCDQDSAVTPDVLADLFSRVRGEGHCVAMVPGRGVVAYRGAVSSRPLFYSAELDEPLLVASHIRSIRALRPSKVDLAGLAPFLVPQLCDKSGSAWQSIYRLPPGHMVIWWDGEFEVVPLTEISALDVDGADRTELAEQFRHRLVAAVDRCSSSPDGILLSGGIDSSALACAYMSRNDAFGRAYTLSYKDPLTACDERAFAEDVARACGIEISHLSANHLLPLVADYPEGDEPEPWAYAGRNWAMLKFMANDNDIKPLTAVTGEGGDELLLGQVFSVADRIARGDVQKARREIDTFTDPDGTDKVVHSLLTGEYDSHGARIVRAFRDLPPWLSPDYVQHAGIVERLATTYPELGAPGQITKSYSRALIAEAGAAGRVQCGGWWPEMGYRVGVSITYPFFDPDLVSLIWALPPEALRDQGKEKIIMREALADLLPASVARRHDKAEALALLHAGLGESVGLIRDVAHASPLNDLGIIDAGRLVNSIDRYLAGEYRLGPSLWATVSVHNWLKHYASEGIKI